MIDDLAGDAPEEELLAPGKTLSTDHNGTVLGFSTFGQDAFGRGGAVAERGADVDIFRVKSFSDQGLAARFQQDLDFLNIFRQPFLLLGGSGEVIVLRLGDHVQDGDLEARKAPQELANIGDRPMDIL